MAADEQNEVSMGPPTQEVCNHDDMRMSGDTAGRAVASEAASSDPSRGSRGDTIDTAIVLSEDDETQEAADSTMRSENDVGRDSRPKRSRYRHILTSSDESEEESAMPADAGNVTGEAHVVDDAAAQDVKRRRIDGTGAAE